MMRVLHVIGPLRTGGAQTQLLGLVKAAHGKLWDATVVATSGGTLAPEFAALGCPFIELRRIGSPGLLRMRRLRQIVADGEFDVVHGNLWQSNMYSRTAVYGRRERPAVVISERNVETSRSRHRQWLDRRLASVTDAYVGNTDAVGNFIRDVHPITDQEVITVPNAVDQSIYAPSHVSAERTGTRVGSIGRLDREKGFDVLIDAAKILAAESDLEVEIAGEGPLERDLRERATGSPVSFRGQIDPGKDVADFLRTLDVFVLPSRSREGRPNVVLEAIATGLPVVTTAIEGMGEVIRGDVLVPPEDPAALARAIRRAIEAPTAWIERSEPAPIDGFDELAHRYSDVFKRARVRASRRGVSESP